MKPPARCDVATTITRTLLSASNTSPHTFKWTQSLERTLHQLGCRDSLTPSLIARVIDPSLLHHPSLSLGFFNWAAQQPNFSHSSISYNSVLKSLSISRQFNSLERVIKEAKTRRIDVDLSIYCNFIGVLVRSKRAHEGFLALREVGGLGEDVYNLVLSGLVSDGHFECACKVFDEMLVRGVRFSTLGLGFFMWRYCRSARISKILAGLDKIRGGDSMFDGSIVALLIVHGLCEVGKVSEAYSVLEELRNRDCKPDFIAYRIIAEAYRSQGPGCIFEVQMVLKKKRKMGVAPRTSEYREFIFELLSQNLIDEAKLLGHMIVDGNFPIEDDVLNALVGSVSSIDPCSSMLFFKFMVGKEKAPTLHTLSNLSRNFCKHDKYEELLDVYHILSSKDYFTDLESYRVMVYSFCEAGKLREAYAALQDMRKRGIIPDILFYNVLMEALCAEDLLRPAKKLWDEMFACGVYGNLQTYNILIKKFAEAGQVEDAQGLYDHMLQKGVLPDAATYTSLLEGLGQDSKFEAAIQVFYKAANQDVRIAESVLAPLVLLLCKAGHLLDASQLLWSNYHLRQKESHVILLKYLSDANEFQTAINHLKQIMAVCPSLLQEISREIFALLSSSSKPEPILQLLREIQHSKLNSTDDSWKQFCEQLLKWIPGVTTPPMLP